MDRNVVWLGKWGNGWVVCRTTGLVCALVWSWIWDGKISGFHDSQSQPDLLLTCTLTFLSFLFFPFLVLVPPCITPFFPLYTHPQLGSAPYTGYMRAVRSIAPRTRLPPCVDSTAPTQLVTAPVRSHTTGWTSVRAACAPAEHFVRCDFRCSPALLQLRYFCILLCHRSPSPRATDACRHSINTTLPHYPSAGFPGCLPYRCLAFASPRAPRCLPPRLYYTIRCIFFFVAAPGLGLYGYSTFYTDYSMDPISTSLPINPFYRALHADTCFPSPPRFTRFITSLRCTHRWITRAGLLRRTAYAVCALPPRHLCHFTHLMPYYIVGYVCDVCLHICLIHIPLTHAFYQIVMIILCVCTYLIPFFFTNMVGEFMVRSPCLPTVGRHFPTAFRFDLCTPFTTTTTTFYLYLRFVFQFDLIVQFLWSALPYSCCV